MQLQKSTSSINFSLIYYMRTYRMQLQRCHNDVFNRYHVCEKRCEKNPCKKEFITMVYKLKLRSLRKDNDMSTIIHNYNTTFFAPFSTEWNEQRRLQTSRIGRVPVSNTTINTI